jgi:hypothetical protein
LDREYFPIVLSEQVVDEKVFHFTLTVRSAQAMVGAGHDEEVKILASLNQRVDKAQGGFRRDIVVHLSNDQQQLAPEL